MRIGPYDVGELIGEGGMGRVYRAHDARLGRDVAIKVLPAALLGNPDRVARFQREAQLLAAFSHPNIAAIYGFEETEDVGALVLELVEGPTLSDRLHRGAIPLDEALPIARQVADALEAAHEKSIVHRDLKPSNIKLRPDGTVKVLDFGLAKMADPGGPASALSQSPTLLTASMPGTILGTAAYMAPEQAKGRDADRRADIWAFGWLFEMLTGRAIFAGETVSEVLANVLKSDPDWRTLPAETPESIRRLLRRCLERDPKKRLQHIGDARLEIDDAANGETMVAVVNRVARGREIAAWTIAALLGIATVTKFVTGRKPERAPAEVRLEIAAPPTHDPVSLALSPDGSRIVFAGNGRSGSQLWLRSLDSVSARPLAGTSGGRLPFWSPDSRSIGFVSDGQLRRLDIDSGAITPLANIINPYGGAWGPDNVILAPPFATGPIQRFAATGGDATAVTRLESPQFGHAAPWFLPDGKHFVYYVRASQPNVRGVYVNTLDGGDARRLFDADAGAIFGAGHLLFVRQGTLFAQPFDVDRLTPGATATTVAEGVAVSGLSAAVSAAASGAIVYRTGTATSNLPSNLQGRRQLVWFDRSGHELGRVGGPIAASWFSLSPDGRTVAAGRTLDGNLDIWLIDVGRAGLVRLTSDPSIDNAPIWSPDGKSIVFESYAGGRSGDLYEKPVSGAGAQQLVLSTPVPKFPSDWSSDGSFILFSANEPKTGFDIWGMPARGDRKPFPVVQTNFDERNAQFSPDAKWIAYQSNESGHFEIYARRLDGSGAQIPVSVGGGEQPTWRHDGRELFYVAADNRLMSVPIRHPAGGEGIELGAAVALFDTHLAPPVALSGLQYMASPDGQRFLVATVVGEEAITSPITVILNWKPGLNH